MPVVKGGTTSWRGYRFRAFDSAGDPVTTLTHASAGASAGYRRTGAARQSITLSTLTNVEDSYSSGAMKHEGAGWYILHVPDAAIAAGVDEVGIDLSFDDATIVNAPIRLLGFDPRTELTTAALAFLDAAISSRSTYAGGAVASVTGAVGSVTGNVGGNVAGSVGSVTGNVGGNVAGSVGSVAAGGITAASIATDAIDADAIAADAVTELQSGLATAADLATVDGNVDLILEDTGTTLPSSIAALPTVSAIWSGITATAGNFLADHVLRRSWASAAASANGDAVTFRSLLGAAAKLVNRVAVAAGVLTVYEDDDVTPLATQTVTTDSGAEPVTEVNTD